MSQCAVYYKGRFTTANRGKSERSVERPLFPLRNGYSASFMTFFVCHTDNKAKIE
jgi:hypothetical protein